MPWFKVDDNLAFHAKTVAAGNPAMGLWVRAGAWCAQQVTDGFIPDHIISVIGTPAQAKKLVQVRLWDDADGGFRFHQWTDRQPSRVDVEAERAAARERMRAARASRKGRTTVSSQRQEDDSTAKRNGQDSASSQVSAPRSGEQEPVFGRSSEDVRGVFGQPDPVPVPVPTRPSKTVALRDDRATDSTFAAFWDAYGKKVGRGAAEKAWTKATKSAEAEDITRAAAIHAEWHKRAGTEARFIPHASTWLNEKRWADERTDVPVSRRANGDIDWDAAMERARVRDERSAG